MQRLEPEWLRFNGAFDSGTYMSLRETGLELGGYASAHFDKCDVF